AGLTRPRWLDPLLTGATLDLTVRPSGHRRRASRRRKERTIMSRVRLNLANPQELLEIPGLEHEHADAIVKLRAEPRPIAHAGQLSRVLGRRELPDGVLARIDFDPADDTAPEAPGA